MSAPQANAIWMIEAAVAATSASRQTTKCQLAFRHNFGPVGDASVLMEEAICYGELS